MSGWADTAHALKNAIVAARAAMDEDRRCPDALAQDFAEAGFFKLCVPKIYGGAEASPLEVAAALEALAQADASAAWCVMIGSTTGALAAYLAPEAAQEIFGPKEAIVTGVYAPTGKAREEGQSYRVNGQWKWNSAGQNSTWLAAGCLVMEGDKPKLSPQGAPVQRMILAPRAQVNFIDTWRTSGLRGTGSGDMAFKDVVAPAERSVSLVDDAPRIEAPLYKFPVFGLLAMGIAAVACGNARGALDDFVAAANSKKAPNGRSLAERSATQAMFAQAQACFEGARAFFFAEIAAAWAEARNGAAISMMQRARLRLAATNMTRVAADVVRRLQDHIGGSGVFLDDPLNRRVSDAQTATAHIMIAPATYELTGRVLLGGKASSAEL